ncbi:MAG: ATP-dependent zinc metalloprotease FtsH [Gammaproteobacteria bacterium]|nr:MAG: ATP-dependent zinc metalloprotease FtsH [Gammaproteobacteria bacterium]
MNDLTKNMLLWLVIAVVLISLFNNFNPGKVPIKTIEYSTFKTDIRRGKVEKVEINPNTREILGTTKNGEQFRVMIPLGGDLLENLLEEYPDITVKGTDNEESSFLAQLFISWFPMLLLIGVWIFFMRQMQGGGGRGAMSFGKSKARLLTEEQSKTTFADVAGCDEAKEEVSELVDFLKDPGRFQRLGGKLPRGILMVGPPGTGKTLLARAIAGEARVPFFTISGSDFVEMFVGVGASRVRDMFEQAKKTSPCIIFIDEIDAVGRHRGAGLGGGHDEREQTLNQLLVEMDGFDGDEGVIVIAATNRPDVLDPALLRPGRFDRQVTVGLPDIRGREMILKVHMRKVPIDDDVDAGIIARGTPGFSGADLANLVNEAALFAAKANRRLVHMEEFEKAKDKILMGTERRSMVMSIEEKNNTAYHEAGHAIIGCLQEESDPVYKVTIIPRGRALGLTMSLPEQDRYSYSKDYFYAQLAMLYGGRIAEEMIHGEGGITTGASNDIQRATKIAHNMVTAWGFSERMGPLTYAEDEGEVFLGRSVTQHKTISDQTAKDIDEEVRDIINRSYLKAETMLKENEDILHSMAEALMTYETIDADQIQDLMARKEVRKPKGWDDNRDDTDNSSSSTSEKPSKPKKADKPEIGGTAEEI